MRLHSLQILGGHLSLSRLLANMSMIQMDELHLLRHRQDIVSVRTEFQNQNMFIRSSLRPTISTTRSVLRRLRLPSRDYKMLFENTVSMKKMISIKSPITLSTL